MKRYMEKTVLGLGIVVIGASLLTACNTLQDAANGVENTTVAIGKTVTGTVGGAKKDVNNAEKAVTAHHKAHHKAHKKAHHKVHHKAMKKAAKKPAVAAEANAPAAEPAMH